LARRTGERGSCRTKEVDIVERVEQFAAHLELYMRGFHGWGLLTGWVVGMAYGTVTAYNVVNQANGNHFAGSLSMIPGIDQMGYIALTAFAINALVSVIVSAALAAFGIPHGHDETTAADYLADEGDPRVSKRFHTAVH